MQGFTRRGDSDARISLSPNNILSAWDSGQFSESRTARQRVATFLEICCSNYLQVLVEVSSGKLWIVPCSLVCSSDSLMNTVLVDQLLEILWVLYLDYSSLRWALSLSCLIFCMIRLVKHLDVVNMLIMCTTLWDNHWAEQLVSQILNSIFSLPTQNI